MGSQGDRSVMRLLQVPGQEVMNFGPGVWQWKGRGEKVCE